MAALVEHRCDGKCAEKHSCEAPGYDGTLCGKPAKASIKTWTTADAKRVMDRLELLPPDKAPA